MTNYEFIKSLEGTRMGAALSHINSVKVYSKQVVGETLSDFMLCKECKLHEKEGSTCHASGCFNTIMKWLDSPVDDIIVLSKLPKEYPLQSKMEFEQGWNACISYILTQMLSSDEENIE